MALQQQQQETMCEMKSSCPVPRGTMQHTEQGAGAGEGAAGGCTAERVPNMGTLTGVGGERSAAWGCASPGGEAGGGLLVWERGVAAVGLGVVGGTALLD